MAQYSGGLDEVFQALADPTRRAVIHQLGRGPASVGDLARAATMTALAGEGPAGSVAPDFITERAASHIGHYWAL